MTNQDKIKNIGWATLLILSIVTLGLYLIYWMVLLKRALVEQGEKDLPSSWLIIIPIANVFFLWKVLQSVEKLSKNKINALPMMVLSVLFMPATVIIVHDWVLSSK